LLAFFMVMVAGMRGLEPTNRHSDVNGIWKEG